MGNNRSTFGWYAASITAAVFIAVTVIVVPLFIGSQQLFNPEFYKQTLREKGVYENFPQMASKQLSKAMSGGKGSLPYLNNLSAAQWEMILSDLLPSTWLQSQAESLIDQFFSYLESNQSEMKLLISLVDIKVRLGGEVGTQAVINLLKAQPACTFNDMMDLFFEGLFGGLESLPSCRPPEDLIREFIPALQTTLNGLARGIPDEIDLGPMAQEAIAQTSYGLLDDPRLAIKLLRLMINLSALIPVGLLAMLTFFGVRSLSDWLLWWGVPFSLTGIAMLAMAFVLSPLINFVLLRILFSNLPAGRSQGLVAVGMSIWGELTRSLAISVAWIAAGFLLIGLVMSAVGVITWWIRKKQG